MAPVLRSCLRKEGEAPSRKRPVGASPMRVKFNPSAHRTFSISPRNVPDMFFADPSPIETAAEAAEIDGDLESVRVQLRQQAKRARRGFGPAVVPASSVAEAEDAPRRRRAVCFDDAKEACAEVQTGAAGAEEPRCAAAAEEPQGAADTEVPKGASPTSLLGKRGSPEPPADASAARAPAENAPGAAKRRKEEKMMAEIEGMSVFELKNKIREVAARRRERERRVPLSRRPALAALGARAAAPAQRSPQRASPRLRASPSPK